MKKSNKLKKGINKKIFIVVSTLVLVLLLASLAAFNKMQGKNTTTTQTSTSKKLSGKTIREGGTYDITGNSDAITINTDEEVVLNLKDVTIDSKSQPAIYVENAKKVTINLSGKNVITSSVTESLDAAIYSKSDLELNGDGTLSVTSNIDGIVSKDNLVIDSGTYELKTSDDGLRGKDSIAIKDGTFNIDAGGDAIKASNDQDEKMGNITILGGTFTIKSGDDAVHACGLLNIKGGKFTIDAAEGLEATYVKIDDGTININATDDGINAGEKGTGYEVTAEINGGDITINMGNGDTDGIDSNGNLYINGGKISINAKSPFDYDKEAKYTGGTLIVNGETTNEITNQMMGGAGHMTKGRNTDETSENNRGSKDGNMTNGDFKRGRR